MDLYKPTKEFDFNLLSLESPQSIQGGTHFTKINMNNDKPLYIQMPKCATKQGVVKTNRGMYSDLLYNKNNSEALIDWLLALEKHCQSKINERRELWFVSEMSEDDIETYMTPVYRLYKSGKNLLIRTMIDVDRATGTGKCMVYDENEDKLEYSALGDSNIIPLILIEGIKFTSKSFDIEIKLVQAMVLNKDPEVMQTCLIKRDGESNSKIAISPPVVEAPPPVVEAPPPPVVEAPPPPVVEAPPPVVEAPPPVVEAPPPVVEAPPPVVEAPPPVVEAPPPVVEAPINHEQSKGILDYDYVQEEQDYLEKINNDLEEITIEPDDSETVSIKEPNEIYAEIYKAARAKAKRMRKAAIEAFLDAKKIKTQHLLDDVDSSDEEYSSDEELNSF
jgi:hypothetical protein